VHHSCSGDLNGRIVLGVHEQWTTLRKRRGRSGNDLQLKRKIGESLEIHCSVQSDMSVNQNAVHPLLNTQYGQHHFAVHAAAFGSFPQAEAWQQIAESGRYDTWT